jgi:hypothetical protein
MSRRVFLFLFASAAIAPIALGSACGDPSHIFEGRLFIQDRGCLGTTSSVDVVEGERPGECGPTCLAQPNDDGGRAVYVATMCGPYPYRFDAAGTDPLCPSALAALARNDTCLLNGGSSSPAPAPADAGSD